MLRRIKKDVENELTDKVEVMLYCPLTLRQKLLYRGLKQKIRIEELLQNLGGSGRSASAPANSSGDNAITSSLMNLVMQFRKVRSPLKSNTLHLSILMPVMRRSDSFRGFAYGRNQNALLLLIKTNFSHL